MFYIVGRLNFIVLPAIKYVEASPSSNDYGELIGVAVAPLDHNFLIDYMFLSCTVVTILTFYVHKMCTKVPAALRTSEFDSNALYSP